MAGDNFARLKKAGYKIIGGHSAVKLCAWCKKAIKSGGAEFCYKQKFYGIESHRCLQMTPALPFCTLKCRFCWRDTDMTFPKWSGAADEPEEIIEKSIEAQRELLSGLGGVPHSEKFLKEAREPKHAAISLAGEPLLYEKMPEMISELRKRKMTSFIVTNGTLPDRLERLSDSGALPTQLYVSLSANSAEMFERINNPLVRGGWERLNITLEMLPQLKTRKVIRMTMTKIGMKEPEKYAALIGKAKPDFVEIKAAMSVGFARARMNYADMLKHAEIKSFAEKLAEILGYEFADEKADSRVALLKK
ncbi:MAG: 4-demethylwyosine synthase TYW1 [Nanoarchaeota archaeon]|nr:4-demethylwyosine synthase TYW1 [Nanoarchaeota archaeon]